MNFFDKLSPRSKQFFLIGIITHLFAAYFSAGFFNLDEQTQVLNLVGHKLGHYNVNYLSDQYTLAIRCWFHPALYLWCSKILLFFISFNPFVFAFFFRLFSSVLGIGAIVIIYKTFREELLAIEAEELYFFITGFIWYLPFLHARTSNENICASLFILGLYFLKNGLGKKSGFLAGFFFGFSFATRFQIAIMIATCVLWFILSRKKYLRTLFVIMGFLLSFILCLFLDAYMYGHFTFAPYNYFHLNIALKYADAFGVSPWYNYFIYCFKECTPPLAIITIGTFFYMWLKHPKHLLTSITLPFFVIHSLIGHKEFRFLFPLAPFLPIILVFVLHSLNWRNLKSIRTMFLVFNIPLLIYFCFTPATSTQRYFRYLYDRQIPVTKVYVLSPYEDNSKFYFKHDIEYSVIKSEEVRQKTLSATQVNFLTKSLSEQELVLHNKQCKLDFSLYPQWIYQLDFIKKRRTFRSWSFIECRNII